MARAANLDSGEVRSAKGLCQPSPSRGNHGSLGIATWRKSWISRQVSSVFFQNSWTVGFVRAHISRFLENDFTPKIEWVPHTGCRQRFLADPFLFDVEGSFKILAEEFDYTQRHGRIVEVDIVTGECEPAILGEAHLSYPYLFRHADHHYCVPESSYSNEVSLYAYDTLRKLWQKQCTILHDACLIDPSIIRYDGSWWLFCSNLNDGDDDRLYIYHADDLYGPWTPHVNNPVKAGRESSRPGGTLFVHRGELYRPAQDNSLGYGEGLVIHRVTELSRTRFKEEPVRRIREIPGVFGPIHTLSGCGDMTGLDSKRRLLSLQAFPRMVLKKVRRVFGMKTSKLY